MGIYGGEPRAARRAGDDDTPAHARTALSEALAELRRLTRDPLFDGFERALADLGNAPTGSDFGVDTVRKLRLFSAEHQRVAIELEAAARCCRLVEREINQRADALLEAPAHAFGVSGYSGAGSTPSPRNDVEALRVVLSIGPTETSHLRTWHDKAGNAPPVTDGSLVFPDFNSPAFSGEAVKKNLIMPEPCIFLSRKLPDCSIVRPTSVRGAALGAASALTRDGLFIGQSREFFEALGDLAADADRARREI